MRAIVLCGLLAVLLFQEAQCAAVKKANLRCHACMLPPNCKNFGEQECSSTQDTCQRTHSPIKDKSGTENTNNYYAAHTQDIMVWERLCTTKRACERAQKAKLNQRKERTVECCHESMCNA